MVDALHEAGTHNSGFFSTGAGQPTRATYSCSVSGRFPWVAGNALVPLAVSRPWLLVVTVTRDSSVSVYRKRVHQV